MTDLAQSNLDQNNAAAIAATRQQEADMPAGPERENLNEDGNQALFPTHQSAALENEWRAIQTNFVDSPRNSVEQADALVKKTIDILSSSFGEMRSSMERTWEKDGDVSTEELRMAMQNYRSFFKRLLSI